MTQTQEQFEKDKGRLLGILRGFPHPGNIFLDVVGTEISGLTLRPKSIPEKLAEGHGYPYDVELQIMKGERSLCDNSGIRLNLHSQELLKWLKGEQNFAISVADVGQSVEKVLERRKNFIKNLLHKFLDNFSLTLTVDDDCEQNISDEESYPTYFWMDARTVSGTLKSSNLRSIKMHVSGVSSSDAIEDRDGYLWCEYSCLFPQEMMPLMRTVFKWHKALIGLYHLMKKGMVEIPIDFGRLEKIAWDEMSHVPGLDNPYKIKAEWSSSNKRVNVSK